MAGVTRAGAKPIRSIRAAVAEPAGCPLPISVHDEAVGEETSPNHCTRPATLNLLPHSESGNAPTQCPL